MHHPPLSLRPLHHRDQLGPWLRAAGLSGSVAEIGVLYGGYTAKLLEGPCYVHGIDPWINQPESVYHDGANKLDMEQVYRTAMDSVGRHPRCTLHRMFSHEGANLFRDGELSAVYLDGNHALEAISADIRLWFPKVAIGGIFSGHDFYIRFDGDTNSNAQQAVLEFAEIVQVYPQVTWCNSWWFRKTRRMADVWEALHDPLTVGELAYDGP